jgi:hypothetical protein
VGEESKNPCFAGEPLFGRIPAGREKEENPWDEVFRAFLKRSSGR